MKTFDEIDLYSGLAALHWSTYDVPSKDYDFFKRIVEQTGGLTLDVACGAGRLLRPMLKAGLPVEGVDSSADMLAMCRQRAEAAGLAPVLYCQKLQALDLPKRYDCMYIPCGSFACVMGQDNAIEAMRRLYLHLRPGGVLAFNIYCADWEDFDYNNPTKERRYPTAWQPHEVKELGDGRRLVIERRVMDVDPVEQVVSEQRRYHLYDGDTLLQEEIHAGQFHWYFRKEMLLLLRMAGFTDVRVTGDYTDEDFGPQHTETMVFICRKPQG